MSDNIIYNDRDEAIGFFGDLLALYEELIADAVKAGDFEEVKMLAEQAEELKSWQDFGGLLVISENNGMGMTISKYEGE